MGPDIGPDMGPDMGPDIVGEPWTDYHGLDDGWATLKPFLPETMKPWGKTGGSSPESFGYLPPAGSGRTCLNISATSTRPGGVLKLRSMGLWEPFIAKAKELGYALTRESTLVTTGRYEVVFQDDAGEFEDVLAFCRRAGYRPELAWTCCDYADALLQRASTSSVRTDDRQKAMSLLDESLSISAELSMRPLRERAQDRLDRSGAIAPDAPDYPKGLSQREVEVLRLLAQGKSNREIGVELVITEGTVRRHVSNVYQKIGATNRSEATSYALREGLLSFE